MKTLKDLVQGLDLQITGSPHVPISDITFDSRKVGPGSLFVALRGVHHDGHAFIPAALKAGASAILAERPVESGASPLIVAAEPLKLLGLLGAKLWDSPSHKLLMVGITGTNGKTTTSYLVESILRAAGRKPGVLGTINYRFGGVTVPAPNTTPFASELQRFLADIVRRGGDSVAMEVSSHALALGRTNEVEFDVAVFTNLTQDHLDFHKTMEAYGQAKAKLFQDVGKNLKKTYPQAAVINCDDPHGELMSKGAQVRVLTYSLGPGSDISVRDLICDARGSRFTLVGPKGLSVSVDLPLLGDYNVSNALAAAGVGISQGYSGETIKAGLEKVDPVPGRMERIGGHAPFTVVVDYAHTEDALRKVLGALRKLNPSRILCVFGCGGDRDRTKRPLMGQAAAELCEEVYVTSDNPRSEDPKKIVLDIEVGVRRVRADHYRIILDRSQAIEAALKEAKTGDIVLVAGKGHETYQILGDETIHFDDREEAQKALAKLGVS